MPTDPALPDRMADVAAEFLAALDGRGRATAQLPFTDEDERTRWFYTPVLRAGLPLRDMDPGQQRHAHRLLALGLSAPGYVTASTIMGLENTLDAEEGFIRDWYSRPRPRPADVLPERLRRARRPRPGAGASRATT